MTKLFQEFAPIDFETWILQIKKDLKDKPLEVLESNPERDVSIRAYNHPKQNKSSNASPTFANNFAKTSNNWAVRIAYETGKNKDILNDLNNGVNAIGLRAVNDTQFKEDSKNILFEHIVSDLQFESKKAALEILVPKNSHLNFDVISINAQSGKEEYTINDFIDFYQKRNKQKCIWVDGYLYGQSGATTIQELAFTLSHLNEYIHALNEAGIDLKEVFENVIIEISVNENYFLNIAKFRALRELVATLFSAYSPKFELNVPVIYAKTSSRYLAQNDSNNNFLRQTTQAMSAVLGGCDVLTISNLKSNNEKDELRNHRMSINIQLVLREESFLDKVADPSAGSMYVESLTDQIIEKAWNLFKEIENQGGHLACLKSDIIQNIIEENQKFIEENIQTGKKIFLGVNKFPNAKEKWLNVPLPKTSHKTEFKRLHVYQAEAGYISKTVLS